MCHDAFAELAFMSFASVVAARLPLAHCNGHVSRDYGRGFVSDEPRLITENAEIGGKFTQDLRLDIAIKFAFSGEIYVV